MVVVAVVEIAGELFPAMTTIVQVSLVPTFAVEWRPMTRIIAGHCVKGHRLLFGPLMRLLLLLTVVGWMNGVSSS